MQNEQNISNLAYLKYLKTPCIKKKKRKEKIESNKDQNSVFQCTFIFFLFLSKDEHAFEKMDLYYKHYTCHS